MKKTMEQAIKSMHNLNLVLSITESERAAVNTAIDALEKQIPKKPLDVCEPCVRWGICPVCKGELNMLGGKPNRIFASEKYCKDCGQAILWESE